MIHDMMSSELNLINFRSHRGCGSSSPGTSVCALPAIVVMLIVLIRRKRRRRKRRRRRESPSGPRGRQRVWCVSRGGREGGGGQVGAGRPIGSAKVGGADVPVGAVGLVAVGPVGLLCEVPVAHLGPSHPLHGGRLYHSETIEIK